MKFLPTLLFLFILNACSIFDRNRQGSDKNNQITFETNKIVIDTLKRTYPIHIGNDQGLLKIVGIKTFENQKLITSNFTTSIHEIPSSPFSQKINMELLIDSNTSVYLKDTNNHDFLNGASISNIEFNAVRANTLNFNITLENPIENKEIAGGFNVFYRTKKKGIVYGWVTREINEMNHNSY